MSLESLARIVQKLEHEEGGRHGAGAVGEWDLWGGQKEYQRVRRMLILKLSNNVSLG